MALVGFSLSNAVAYRLIESSALKPFLGKGVFMPGVFSWQVFVPLFLLFFLTWMFVAIWNEKTEKFVLF